MSKIGFLIIRKIDNQKNKKLACLQRWRVIKRIKKKYLKQIKKPQLSCDNIKSPNNVI